jgi:hypothetical protein
MAGDRGVPAMPTEKALSVLAGLFAASPVSQAAPRNDESPKPSLNGSGIDSFVREGK